MIDVKSICEYVEANRDECIRCAQEIISTPSVTPDEEPVSLVFTKWMEDNGLKVDKHEFAPHRPNLFAEWKGSQPGKRFVFNGHMDVFPPDAKGMPYGPWSAEIHDGKIWGRGSADMKGGDCAALMAVILLKRMGFDPKGSVLLSWMCDEEFGSRLGVIADLKAGLIQGDFGICMEATNGRVIAKHGGIIRGNFTYEAEARHAGEPYELGDDALKKAHTAVTELYKIEDRLSKLKPNGEIPRPCFTISVFKSGDAANLHTSKAEVWFDRRLVPGEDHDAALKEITDVLDRLKATREGYDYTFTITNDRPLLDVDYDDPFCKLCAEAYEEVTGKPTDIGFGAWGSDAAWIFKETGMPMPNFAAGVTLGPGGSGAQDEHLPVEDYISFIKIYMVCMVKALS